MIVFSSIPYSLNGHLILSMPHNSSAKLPSRSQIIAEGTINGIKFQAPLEPDGRGSHWIDVTKKLAADAHVSIGHAAEISLIPSRDWPEPIMPKDFIIMLETHPKAKETWNKATTMAHWEWLRWTIATRNPDTFKKHIEVSRDKLTKGMRRPCCFNRSSCTVADVAKSGVLIGLAS